MRTFKTFNEVIERADEVIGDSVADWSFSLHDWNDSYLRWCFESWSPAGEDIVIEYQEKDPQEAINNIAKYLDNYGFDVDEHVELWIDKRGENGVPSTARELIEDAEAIEGMIIKLVHEFNRLAAIFYNDSKPVDKATCERWIRSNEVSDEDMSTYYRVKDILARQNLAVRIQEDILDGLQEGKQLFLTDKEFKTLAREVEEEGEWSVGESEANYTWEAVLQYVK